MDYAVPGSRAGHADYHLHRPGVAKKTRARGAGRCLSGKRRRARTLSHTGPEGHRIMTVATLTCAMVLLCVLFYVFYLPGKLQLGPEKTRLSYLQERKEAIYENLRDLNFEQQAGKLPDEDYQSLKLSLEDEAAGVLAEMARLEQAATAVYSKKGARV